MVRVRFWLDRQGRYRGFEATGHAGWAAAGQDIVCAAVSALTQATVVGLARVARVPLRQEQEQRRGVLRCSWQPDDRWGAEQWQAVGLLCETLWQALQEVVAQYPHYVQVARVIRGEDVRRA